MISWTSKIGAAFYVLWGVFHIIAAKSIYGLAQGATGMVHARLMQGAFYLLCFAIGAILVAVLANWRNSRTGWILNGAGLAIADIPFVAFVLVPGLTPWWPGLAGPILWLLGLTFSTVALFTSHSRPSVHAHA